MTQEKLWSRYKEWLYVKREHGFMLDISRIHFDAADFNSYDEKLRAAIFKMAELDAGAIANPDEGRMVGHYWLRNPELSPSQEIKEKIISLRKEIEAFAEKIHRGDIAPENGGVFESFIVVGIGGSALGPQLLQAALTAACAKTRAYFFDNTDPDGMNATLESIPNLEKTLVIVISKSGGTKETRNGQLIAKEYFSSKGISISSCFVAVTQEGSLLDKTALQENWLARFPMWDWVGGRTSLWCAVGLLPAALLGIDIEALLSGASVMDDMCRVEDPRENPAALFSFAVHHVGNGKGEKNMVILPYKDRLSLFSKYMQQLIMESLGKEHDLEGNIVNQGVAVFGNKGSTDQHSYVQQLRDGVNNFFAVFIEVLKDRTVFELNPTCVPAECMVGDGVTAGDYLSGFYQGTRHALFESGRESISISIDELNAHSLGQLLAFFERFVGIYALLINVNAYHQPGVEAGKKAAEEVLAQQSSILEALHELRTATLDEIVSLKSELNPETVFKVLRHLASNKRVEIVRGKDIFLDAYTLPAQP